MEVPQETEQIRKTLFSIDESEIESELELETEAENRDENRFEIGAEDRGVLEAWTHIGTEAVLGIGFRTGAELGICFGTRK